MNIVVCVGRSEQSRIAVAREKEAGYGREINEENSSCSRQAFIQNVQDEISSLFREQNDENDGRRCVFSSQTQSHGPFGQE